MSLQIEKNWSVKLWGWGKLVAFSCLGALVAQFLSWPLPFVLGPLIFVACFQIFGGQTTPIAMVRKRFVAVLGLYLGAGFSPPMVQALLASWPTIAMIAVLVPVSAGLGFFFLRYVLGFDLATAWFGAIPGGLTEMAVLGEAEDGDAQLIAAIHSVRVVWLIIAIPIAFSFFIAIQDASFVKAGGVSELSAFDWLIFLILSVGLSYLGDLSRLPAGAFIVPLVGACLVYGMGWIDKTPPLWLLVVTQVVMGGGLGQRFKTQPISFWWKCLKCCVALSGITVALAILAAWLGAQFSTQSWSVLFLAFAPGGLAEMSLLAVSLDQAPVFVSSHHIFRIVVALFVGAMLFSLIKWIAKDRSS